MDFYDVIVAGAGPAGSRAARTLSEAGLNTLLLEKAKLPRYKTCAGGVTHKALSICGLNPDLVVDQWVQGARCCLGPTTHVDLRKDDSPLVAMVRREKFDGALAEAAQQAGARLLDQVNVLKVEENADKVWVRTNNGSFSASYLIGADGAASRVRKDLGLRVKTNLNPAIEAELSPPSGRLETLYQELALYDMKAVPGGYAWVFPKQNHYAVGLCSTNPNIKNIKELYEKFLDTHPHLKKCGVLKFSGWLIPLGTRGGKIATQRCLLAGDAAGCVDPLTGEGIYYALRTGILAAKTIIRSDLGQYQKAVDKEIYSDLRVGRWFAKFFYLMPHLAFKVLLKDKRVVNRYCQVMAGDACYKDILKLMLKNWWRLRLR